MLQKRENEPMRMTMLLPIAVLALAACANAPAQTPTAQSVTRVVSTTSFGMCMGYCQTRLEISEGQAVLTRDPHSGRGGASTTLPVQRFTTPVTAAEWQEIQRLAAAVDFDALPDVIGCPDCADGGAEGLAVEGATGAEGVSFDYGASLPAAQALLDRVRALRARLTPRDDSQ